jgi:hypothetical protein
VSDDAWGAAGAAGTLDEVDLTIVDWVGEMYGVTDPVPHGLLERIGFAMAPLTAGDEVARLLEDRFEATGVRGAEHSRTVTFDSPSLTIVIQASPAGAAVRLDGWLAPPAARPIRLRAGERELHTESDDLGRFVVPSVPHGLVQLIVDTGEGDEPDARSVVTMAVLL